MSDLRRINQQFILNLVLFIAIILGFLSAALAAIFLIKDDNIVYLILFIILVAALIFSGIFRNRIDSITNLSYLIKIRHHASEPLSTNKTTVTIEDNLRTMGFKKKISKKKYTLFYKSTKDSIKRIFRRHMLEVVILSRTNAFFIDDVNDDIDNLQLELHKQKLKVDKLFVTQIQDVEALTNEVKEQIKEIVFLRTRRGIISVINIGLHASSKQAVLLYSDTYRPSLYYEYHISQIKTMIK